MTKNDGQMPNTSRRGIWGFIFLLLTCMIMVGGVLVWQIATHSGSRGGSANPDTSSQPVMGSTDPLTPPVPLTARYDEIAKQQVALGLHLTVAQVTAQMLAEPIADLRPVGKQQGFAQDQLCRLVLSALQTAGDYMVSSSAWTHQQADEEMQYWRQQTQLSLLNGVASWFLQH